MPLTAFLLHIESPAVRGVGNGLIHFTPFPRIELPSDQSKELDPQDFPDSVDDYTVALEDGNHPKFFDTLWSLAKREFQQGSNRSYLATEKVESPKRPVGTYGIAEVLFYIGTAIAVPVFVGVLSSLLSTLVTQKILKRAELESEIKNAREEKDQREELIKDRAEKLLAAMDNPMAPNDAICIKIRVRETSKEYSFTGTYHEVEKQLRHFHDVSFNSVRLPGDCHVCNYVGEAFADATLPHSEVGAMTDLATRYEKVFAENTRVRFAEGEAAAEMHKSIDLCAKARELMDQQKYEEAAMILQDGIRGEDSSIELLYNHALCLAELGYEDGARFMLEQVVIRSMNLPPLSEAKDFVLGRLENAQKTTDHEE
jgi:hypothetical protein